MSTPLRPFRAAGGSHVGIGVLARELEGSLIQPIIVLEVVTCLRNAFGDDLGCISPAGPTSRFILNSRA